MHSAVVFEGVSRTRNALINGDYKNYDWDSGYTCHQLGNGSINIQLAQPYIVGSMRQFKLIFIILKIILKNYKINK
jgi:BTB/POZ domain-containing protein 9